ncbi:glycosyltransferase family 2 protein [Ruegeria sp.]|uniref:glycosyltransferase family 2 protein n=1 Tax=Ruegeria sp. TaxID=1879320 RepID=UPI003C7CCA5C
MTPLISFVITTHNRPKLLVRAIKSVIAQGPEAELIVVADEGSRETRDAVAGALRETDSFLSYPGTRGPSNSRNFGRNIARGGWICFLDDDDTITPDYLEQAKPHLIPGTVIYGNYTRVQDDPDLSFGAPKPRLLKKRTLDTIEVQNFIPIGAFLVPIDLARRVDFDTYLASREDWDYLLKLYAFAPFQHVDICGFRYHHAPGPNRNNLVSGERRADLLSIYRRHKATSFRVKRKRAELLARYGIKQSPRSL